MIYVRAAKGNEAGLHTPRAANSLQLGKDKEEEQKEDEGRRKITNSFLKVIQRNEY